MMMMHSHCSTNDGIPIRAGGQVVGRVIGDRFVKRVRGSIHRLTTPPGWALDSQSLSDAVGLGASVVEIVDVETDTIYAAPIERILSKGFRFNRGHGCQICLSLQSWTTHRPGQPQQLSLAWGER